MTGSDQCLNHDNHESNEATKETQTEIVLRPNSVSQKEQEAQTAEIETNNDNQQVVESRQDNSQTAQGQRSDNEETSIGDADIQKILDRDSASLKELSSSKDKDKQHRVKLPQTGNQTDNRTTFVGLVITGLVTIITMFFWKRRKKE